MFCSGCGKEIPDAYAGVRCPSCGVSLIPGAAGPGGAGTPPQAGAPGGIPWEDRATLGFFPALFENLRRCLFEPAEFFERMPKRENLGAALGYLVLLGWVGAAAGFVWSLAIRGPQMAFMRSMGIEPRSAALSPNLEMLIYAGAIVLAPIFILIAAFIASAILHVFLWMLDGAKEGFEATVRVYAYAAGSTAVFQIIPLCGGLVAVIWSLVLQIIGLSRAHGISPGKAALAVLLPLALCCVLIAVLCVLFAGVILATLKGAAH
jgi:hypothetical protein